MIFFCSSKIKVIIFEDWQENNAKVYRDTLDFLEVDTNFLPHYKPVNVRAKPRLERLNYIIYNPALRRISQTVFTPEIHEFVSKKIVDRFLFKKDNKSSIEPETRDRLMRSFKSEVLKISQLIGMDLESKWGYDR